MKKLKATLAMSLAFMAGLTATTLMSGCQPPAPKPSDSNSTSSAGSTDIDAPQDPPADLPEDKPADKPEDKPADKPEDKPADKPEDKPADKPEDKPADNPEDKPADNPEDKPADNPEDKPADKPEDKPADKPEDKPADKPEDKPADKPEDKPADKPEDKPADKPEDKPADKPEDKVGDSTKDPADNQVAKANPQSAKSPIDKSANAPIKPGDWTQWAGTSYRNNTPIADNIPTFWDIGGFDRKTGAWQKEDSQNIKWVADLGSQTYGNAVISNGQVFIGTNNGAGHLARYSSDVDLGCLLAFNEQDGSFLWQHSSEKLPTGRVHDWPLQGICCAPLVEGNRLWFVSSRGHVICLDTEGFNDGEDDGIKAGWGRLFDIVKQDGEGDKVGPALAALKDGKLDDTLREKFAAAGMTLPEEVEVKADGKAFVFTAKVGDADRQFKVAMGGPKLSGWKLIDVNDKDEADEIWTFDMMAELKVSQHNMCSCSVTALGDILFVNTSNGLDESHINIPSPDAPSFVAMNKNTGEVYWTDKSPGANVLHGQWSSPSVATLGGVPQVIYGGGDGWVYSFRADEGKDGKPTLLWKFDANPKASKWILGGRGTRNNIIATPVIYDGLVYVAVGQDPEHGEGVGHVWCINPNLRGDVSPQLAMKLEDDKRVPIPHRRLQAVIEEEGEVAVDNPNSAVIWHYSKFDQNKDGEFDFEEEMHRSCGTVAIKDDILFIADFSGLFHCLNAKTGEVHWTYDMLAAAWGSPLIVGGHVYIGDEDGDVCVFKLSTEAHDPVEEINMESSVYSTPIVANGVLYIGTKNKLVAIAEEKEAE